MRVRKGFKASETENKYKETNQAKREIPISTAGKMTAKIANRPKEDTKLLHREAAQFTDTKLLQSITASAQIQNNCKQM